MKISRKITKILDRETLIIADSRQPFFSKLLAIHDIYDFDLEHCGNLNLLVTWI